MKRRALLKLIMAMPFAAWLPGYTRRYRIRKGWILREDDSV